MDATAWDTAAASVVLGALAVVGCGLLVTAVASSPAARLLRTPAGGPWWCSPHGAKALGVVVAYLGLLVAVVALAFVVVDAYAPARLAWAVGGTIAVVLPALTVTRALRLLVHLAGGGRVVLSDPLPSDYVDVDDTLDDPDLRTARDAAAAGDWSPAAYLLAATLDPDSRSDRIHALAVLASRRGRWLDAWLDAEPCNADALACRVAAGVQRAWMLRGDESEARNVADFLAVLRDVDAEADAALLLTPGDAAVLASRLTIARGLRLGVVEHERRLAQLLAHAPHHRGGLTEALQFKAAKWFGSSDEMLAFARTEAAASPAGHATNLLVVVALLEEAFARGRRSGAAGQRYLASREVRAEILAAADRWTSGGPSPVGRAWAHNLLAYACWLAEMPREALPHLAETRQHLSSWPWRVHDDPRAMHAQVQVWARERAGAAAPD